MKACIIYNQGLGKDYVLYQVVQDFIDQGKVLGIDLIPKSNEDFITYQDQEGLQVLGLDFDPAFILFYDKDLVLARALENSDYRLFNPLEAIALCDDKIKSYQALEGLPLPRTIYGPKRYHPYENPDFAQRVLSILGPKVIVKESTGSFGQQVHLAQGLDQLVPLLKNLSCRSYLIQEYIEESMGRDLRVVLVGDQVLGGMERSNQGDFRANIALGGQGRAVSLSPEEIVLAKACHRRLGLFFSGVDLLYSKEGPLVCEVNSNLSYLGFSKATGLPVGKIILKAILKEIKKPL